MIKKLFFFSILLLSGVVFAQDLDVSLFDDTPNLGRDSKPLDSIRLTPPPAPDIRVDLDNGKTIKITEPTTPTVDIPPLPSNPIELSEPVSPNEPTPTKPEPPRILKDVSLFDIANFSLGETSKEVLQKALKNGFKVTTTQEEVPLYYATDYAYKCRRYGYITPQQVSQCIKDFACKEKTRYISEAILTKKNEVLKLYFTSNATENRLYKILYINKGDPSLNFTTINTYSKLTRQEEFWKAVFDKYGYPDDEQKYIWGDPRKAYMRAFISGSAYNAYLIMEDVRLFNDDYYEADDIEKERPPKNNFAF